MSHTAPIDVLRPVDAGEDAARAPDGNGQPGSASPMKPAPSASMLHMIHDALRGRYPLLLGCGLLVGAAAAAIGWKLSRPEYESEGLVRIAYSMPEVVKPTDQNEPLSNFDTFMQSQKTLISSRRVMDMAIMDPVWKAMGRQVPPSPDAYFAKHLKVDITSRSELIRISVADPDPSTAAAAATSIVNSYSDLYNSEEKRTERQRIGLLEDKQTALQTRIDDLTKQIREKAQEFGTTHLDVFYMAAVARVTKLEGAIDDIRVAIANTPIAASTQAAGAGAASAEEDLKPEMIAMTDGAMRLYLDQRDQRQEELTRLKQSYPDTNKMVVQAQASLDAATAKVNNYLEMYRQFHKATAQNLNDPGGTHVPTAGMSVEALKSNLASLETLLTRSRAEMIALGNKQLDFTQMDTQLTSMQTELSDLAKRMEVLRTEGALGGRLTVVSTGEVPLSPSVDKRLRMAAIAGSAGFVLPAGLLFLLSFVRRRYRYVDDTAKDVSLSNVPLLGMLPEVSRKFDAEVLHATAHGIHQMRVLLSARLPRDAKRSYLITSATEGEGKTNLSVALGMSFAASRRKTLVIDCDFVGRRLTRGFKAENTEGLLESLQEGRIGARARKEGATLHVLPTGRVDSKDACAISSHAIHDLLKEARKEFDIVVIDSGPILGSLEASVVAQEVDGVILTISRGQHPGLVQHALRRLSSVRATVAGAVFNRAKLQDFHGSAYASSQASTPFVEELSVEKVPENGLYRDFGPLVRAVALAMPVAA